MDNKGNNENAHRPTDPSGLGYRDPETPQS